MMTDTALPLDWMYTLVAPVQRIVILSLVVYSPNQLLAQSTHQSLRKGDRQYDLDNYKESEKHYRTAADLEYSNPIALYNLGNALFQQGDWEDAAERYALAAKYAAKVEDQADALRNLGDSYLKLRKFKESVEAYENSLRLHPGDAGTKMNLQLAKKKLQQEEEQKKQQQQQNQGESKNDQKDQQPSQQPQDQQNQQQQQQQNQPKQDQSGQPQQPEPQPDQPQPGKMKKEEAKRLLETAVGTEDQRNARKYRSAQQQNKKKGAKKDW